MLSRPVPLFSNRLFFESQDYELAGVTERVKNIAQDEFDGTSAEVLATAILHDFGTFRPLLLADEAEFIHTSALNGNHLQIEIPYAGDHELWLVRPNCSNSLVLLGAIDEQRSVLVLSYQNPNQNPNITGAAWCLQEFQKRLALIRQCISYQTNMLAAIQASLPLLVKRAIDLRKQQANA
jgi:hypothetical protein